MIYSGAHLVRLQDLQAARSEKLGVSKPGEVPPIASTPDADASGEDTQGALLRFARFIKSEGRERGRRKKAPLRHPYSNPFQSLIENLEKGQLLDKKI